VLRLTDATGTSVGLGRPPRRIVSLVPSLSETLHALGLAGRVVGVTTYCVTPPDGFPRAERIRGTKNPDVSRIVQLAPDLVLANREENRERHVEQLRAAGLTVHVSEPRTVQQAARTVREVGRLVGEPAGADEIARRVETAHRRVRAARPEPPLATFCPVWREPWMAVGSPTYAADLLAASGFALVPEGGRYPRVALHEVRDLAEVVLLPSEPFPFDREHLADFDGWDARVRLVDGGLLTWHGPRTPAALEHYGALARELAGGEEQR
jgi:ABC-type Fe3+-hydroxamate transport system substrate-binding protein